MIGIKNRRGFSLIEVLVALTLIAGSLIVLSMAWSTSHLRLKKMKMNYQVAYLLDLKVAELERKYRNEISLLPEEDEGDFTDIDANYKDYAWKMVSKKFEMPDLGPLLSQQGGDTENPMFSMVLKQMTEFFNQSVRELTVTIIYKVKKNSVQFSASTFMIDYSQSLPMPNLGGGAAGSGGASGTGGGSGTDAAGGGGTGGETN